jgi:predicted sulfurtransferase
MLYCGRCERASALLHEIEKTSDDVSTQGIFMVRGGIERYLKTFPEGGHWKGYNYLFDRRFEQQPELKSSVALEEVYTCIHKYMYICNTYHNYN